MVADVNGDGQPDIVLMWNVLGATWHQPKLTLFIDQGGTYCALTTDLAGQTEKLSVNGSNIVVQTWITGPNDPRCCPTRKTQMRYQGLIPARSKEPRTAYATFNARVETVAIKPAFRAPYGSRPCLVPASGFYGWREEGGRKQPWYFSAADGQDLAFAGLWEEWRGPDAPPLLSCTILVGPANDLVARIHDRMAVILGGDDYATWLDSAQAPETIAGLLRPAGRHGCAAGGRPVPSIRPVPRGRRSLRRLATTPTRRRQVANVQGALRGTRTRHHASVSCLFFSSRGA